MRCTGAWLVDSDQLAYGWRHAQSLEICKMGSETFQKRFGK